MRPLNCQLVFESIEVASMERERILKYRQVVTDQTMALMDCVMQLLQCQCIAGQRLASVGRVDSAVGPWHTLRVN